MTACSRVKGAGPILAVHLMVVPFFSTLVTMKNNRPSSPSSTDNHSPRFGGSGGLVAAMAEVEERPACSRRAARQRSKNPS